MNYQEYKNKKQKEFDELPIFFAFTKKQLAEEMEKRGLKPTDTDKIYCLEGVAAGYYLRSDAKKIRDFLNKPDELPELMKDYPFAEDAFYEEMANHEYHINDQGDFDVLSCFGDIPSTVPDDLDYLFDFLNFTDEQRRAYKDARKRFLKDAAENGWY